MSRFVFKFGGASVKDAEAVKNVAEIIKSYSEDAEILVVVSAMGKTTNALEALHNSCVNRLKESKEHFAAIEKYHLDIIGQLFPEDTHTERKLVRILQQLKVVMEEVHEVKDFDEGYDAIVSFGELLSSQIVAFYLQKEMKACWLDSREYIITNASFREGKVDFGLTNSVIQQGVVPLLENQVVVTQGFIGATIDNKTTTLGREGSDYSAAIYAAALEADEVMIWKDVAGVLTADPKKMPEAELFPYLSYLDAAEMTYYGATVIHPKTIRPLAVAEIPLRVRSFVNPEAKGTLVGPQPKMKLVPAFIFKNNQILISISSKDLSFVTENELIHVLELTNKLNIPINLLQTSAISLSIVTDYHAMKVDNLMKLLADSFIVQYNSKLELVTIKSYTQEAISQITTGRKKYVEQITRTNYQVLLDGES